MGEGGGLSAHSPCGAPQMLADGPPSPSVPTAERVRAVSHTLQRTKHAPKATIRVRCALVRRSIGARPHQVGWRGLDQSCRQYFLAHHRRPHGHANTAPQCWFAVLTQNVSREHWTTLCSQPRVRIRTLLHQCASHAPKRTQTPSSSSHARPAALVCCIVPTACLASNSTPSIGLSPGQM